jgi:GNAT superfamily N-acetyltransferase
VSARAEIVSLVAPVADAALEQLAAVLADYVEGGASVSFMAPFSHAQALAFFRKVAASVASGDTVLLAAKLDGSIVGTVQLGLDTPPNQPHRADIRKLLVHRSARGHGIGAALMAQIEEAARRRGRWLLVLDTVLGENGHRLYLRQGWTQTGLVPDYALFPDGRLHRDHVETAETVILRRERSEPRRMSHRAVILRDGRVAASSQDDGDGLPV